MSNSENNKKRAVITGMGLICALGNNRRDVLESIKSSKNGLKQVTNLPLKKLATQIGGEVDNISINFSSELKDKASKMAYIAAQEAITDSSLDLNTVNPYRIGLSLGTCNGNILTLEALYENFKDADNLGSIYQNHYNAIDYLNSVFNIRGPKASFVTACASSNQAIGYALDLIITNQADVVIVGGSDSFAKSTYAGFNSLQSFSESSCTPFSEKIGLSLGEGAGFLVLESEEHAKKRNAKIHAVVLGYGFNSDAYHATSPDITGEGAARCMKQALKSSGIKKEEICFICAHGTGTEANDKTESMAITKVFGEHSSNLKITSTKSLHGHTLGAAGIIQAIMNIDCMNSNIILPIINFTKEREGCALNYVKNRPAETISDCFLSNSFAFGGNNVSIVVGKPHKQNQGSITFVDKKIVITGMGIITPLASDKNMLSAILKKNAPYNSENPVIKFDSFFLQIPRFTKLRKLPRISQLAIHAVEAALDDARYKIEKGEDVGLLWGVAKGPMKVFEDYYLGILNDGIEFASALNFPHIVQNAIAGQVSIAFGIKGCNTTLAGQFSPLLGLQYAHQLIKQSRNEIFIVGGSDQISMFDNKMMKENLFKNSFISEGAGVIILESEEHAKKRNAKIYAEVEGFSCTSSYWNDTFFESYKVCIENSLQLANLKEKDVDLHISCHFGDPIKNVSEIINIPDLSSSQEILGTLESASSIINIMAGIIALNEGFAPGYNKRNKLLIKDFKNILISGSSLNGAHYSFILKKYNV